MTLNRVVVRDNEAGEGAGVANSSFANTLTLNNSVVHDNETVGDQFDDAGGIRNNGILVVNRSTIENNEAGSGGGISSQGTTTITDSTISDNEASEGGAILSFTQTGNTVEISNSTISGNTATAEGGGVNNGIGPMSITNSTLAFNSAPTGANFASISGLTPVTDFSNTIVSDPAGGGANCSISRGGNPIVNSDGGNLEEATDTCQFDESTDITGADADAILGTLTDNGGPTATRALGTGSDAIDNAVDTSCPETDQRGVVRPDTGCDIGAFEVGDARTAPTTGGDSYTTDEDETLTVAAPGVLLNDGPSDDPLVAVIESGPQNGSVALMEDGSFEYTSDDGFFGEDTFTYRASDGFEESDITTVTITVVEDTDGGGNPNPEPPPGGGGNSRCTIVGTPDNDVLRGTLRRDVICGRGGNDVIRGMGGNDIIRGGPGNDVLHGMGGGDRLFGQAGNDVLRGGPGKDVLRGGPGKDSTKQ